MTELSLKQRLLRYLQNNHGFIASGEIQRIATEKTTYTPSNVSRRLRELENEGEIEVTYRKGHAWYRANKPMSVDAVWASIPDAREVRTIN